MIFEMMVAYSSGHMIHTILDTIQKGFLSHRVFFLPSLLDLDLDIKLSHEVKQMYSTTELIDTFFPRDGPPQPQG